MNRALCVPEAGEIIQYILTKLTRCQQKLLEKLVKCGNLLAKSTEKQAQSLLVREKMNSIQASHHFYSACPIPPPRAENEYSRGSLYLTRGVNFSSSAGTARELCQCDIVLRILGKHILGKCSPYIHPQAFARCTVLVFGY